MHKSNISILTIAILIGFSALTTAKENFIPGTEKPQIFECTDGSTVYVYKSYEIKTKDSPDFEGSNIYVYHPHTNNSDPCTKDYREPYFYIKAGEFGGANTFYGLYKNLIFLDQWTGRDFKRLLAINLDNKSLVFFDTYTRPNIEDGELEYFRTLKAKRQSVRDKIPCPEAEKWKSEGKQVLYVEKTTVNLSTMKKQPSKEFSCKASEPIGSAAPKRYGH